MDNSILKEEIKLNNKCAGFLKFGEYQHMKNFYEKGEIYFNTFEYFKCADEKSDGRADKDEYSYYHYSGEGIKGVNLKIFPNGKSEKGQFFEGGKDILQLTTTVTPKQYTHLLSLSSINIEWSINNNYIIDKRNFAPTKDYVVPIYNPDKFSARLFNTLEKMKYQAEGKFIEYVDKNSYTGEMGAFRKFNKFAYQNEFRIAVNFASEEPQKLYIGSLADIAHPPQTISEFFNGKCIITYKIDGKLIEQEITNRTLTE